MLKLRTVYPYGLNNRLEDEYKKYDTIVIVDNKFPTLSRKHNRISGFNTQKSNNSLSPDKVVIKPKHHLNYNLSDVSNIFTLSLLAMSNYNLKITAIPFQDYLNDTSNSIYC